MYTCKYLYVVEYDYYILHVYINKINEGICIHSKQESLTTANFIVVKYYYTCLHTYTYTSTHTVRSPNRWSNKCARRPLRVIVLLEVEEDTHEHT
jgi:hypothetical protein